MNEIRPTKWQARTYTIRRDGEKKKSKTIKKKIEKFEKKNRKKNVVLDA